MPEGSEIAARYVTIYARMAPGAAREINSTISQGVNQSSKAVSAGLERGVKDAAPKMGATFKSIVGPMLTLSATAAISGFVRKSVDAFSDLEDATGAAGVVFGDSMDKIVAKGDTAAAKLGMSKAQIIDAANTFGTLGKSANLSGDDLADFSNEMTDVAGSLSSFKGGSPEEAILAVGAALRGESEPIRRYGILLDDATLRQRALTLGIVDNVKTALTPQQRVLAAQAEILAQSTDAMGDFERTANSTANVQKTLAAESANLSAEIGEKLAPMIVNAQKAGIGFLRWVIDNQDAITPLVKTVGVLTAAIGGFVAVSKGIEALKAARATIAGLGDAFTAMSTKAKIATATAGAVGLALTAAALIYGNFAQANATAEAAVADFTKAVEADSGALGENTRASIENQLASQGLVSTAAKMGISSQALTDAVMGNGDALDYAQQKMREYMAANADNEGAISGAKVETDSLSGALGAMSGQVQQAQAAYEDYQRSAGDATTQTTMATTAASDAKIAYEDYTKAIQGTYSAQLKLAGSERAAEAAIDDGAAQIKEWTGELQKKYEAEIKADAAAKKRKISDEDVERQAKRRAKAEVAAAIESGKALDINTDAGRKNQEALYAIAETTEAAILNMTDLEKASGQAADRAERGRKEFIKLAKQLGVSKGEAEDLANQLGLIKPKTVDFRVNVEVVGDTSLVVDGKSYIKVKGGRYAEGGPISGGVPGKDSVPALLMPGEHVLTADEVRRMGGHAAVFRMRAMASKGVMRFASGGPVMPTYKGHSLDWWDDYLLSDLEYTRLRIHIKDLQAGLSERETYYTGKGKSRKKRSRQKLRGLERTAAQLELKEAQEQLQLAKDAAAANKSKSGTLADRMARYEQQQQVYDDAASMWQQAAQSLTKSGGISLDPTQVRRSNAAGDVWTEKRETTAADLAKRVGEQANQVETFIDLLGQLRKAGASEALIADVMALGTVEGTKAARLYLADRSALSLANAAYGRLAAGEGRLNALGDQAGKAAVNITVNEAVNAEATAQAVMNKMLAGRS
ncbi:MAG: hypothetical protein QM804_10350 [Propionicimonas sp.]